MNIIRHITSFTAWAAISLAAVAAGPGTAQYPGLENYCYPGNASATVAPPVYADADNAMLRLNDATGAVEKYSVADNKLIETVLDLTHTRETTLDHIDGFTMSPDGSKMLVWTGTKPVYRHSFKASYYVYELRSRLLTPLSKAHPVQQAPSFSPDGRMVVFMAEDNNLYIAKLDYHTEVAVTTDGKINSVINGVPDWTYQEEFATLSSTAWAPDNLTLCFIKYNESEVPTFDMTLYDEPCSADHRYELYPGTFSYKYPVAGKPNSRVTLHSYDIETRKVKEIALPDSRIEYIPRIDYAPGASDRLVVTTLNRDQNRMEVYAVNPRSTVAKSLLVEESKAWIPPVTYEGMRLEAEGIVIISGRSGYNHLYRYSYAGALTGQLTSGDWDVTAYYGSDAAGNRYFQSTATGAINRVVSCVDAKGRVRHISPATGFASASFSPSCKNLLLNYSNSTTPPVYTLMSADGKHKRVIEDNAAVKARYGSMPVKEFFEMPATGDTPRLNGYMVKPAGFSASTQYPVIMYQYSGPGSQEVLDRWEAGWQAYYAMKGYLVVCVDGRGTGGRGRAFEQIVYKRLGHYETIDQLAAAAYVATLPYADASRIGIYGWSYGGYETIMCATAPSNPYRAAVAVAPVTDWRFYDTVYAERYMLTPAMNEDGYSESSTLGRVNNLNGRLLIMAGTSDDNVHLSNTMQFLDAVQADGRFCDLFLFPGMNHSINGCGTRLVVMARMLDYFDRNLK